MPNPSPSPMPKKPRRDAGDNTHVNPINGPIAKSANPNVPGAGNNPGSMYTRASGTILNRAQQLSNRRQVNDERLETLKEEKAVRRKAITAANNKKLQDKKNRKEYKNIFPGTPASK